MAYIPNDIFNKLVDALANARQCPVTGRSRLDQIKLVLGESGDIWPMSLLEPESIVDEAVIYFDSLANLPSDYDSMSPEQKLRSNMTLKKLDAVCRNL